MKTIINNPNITALVLTVLIQAEKVSSIGGGTPAQWEASGWKLYFENFDDAHIVAVMEGRFPHGDVRLDAPVGDDIMRVILSDENNKVYKN